MADELRNRTKGFALQTIRLVESLPASRTANILGGQLLRSRTSVGANYRASCRARSRAEFIAKLGIVEEEADESIYWLELFVESGILRQDRAAGLLREAGEILAMVVASIKTARKRNSSK
jgi:four helix bundle protein